MKYEEIVELVKKAYENADANHIAGHLAIEFDICGEGAGAFYAEVSNGKLDIQPYNYYDHDAAICVEADVLLAVLRGETTMEAAYQAGKIGVDGSLEAVLAFAQIETKAEEAPVEEAPVVEAVPVVEEAPVEEAPVEAAPVEEETPVETAPVAETVPVKKETTSAPAKSAAKKEAKVDPIKAAKKAARAKKKR